MKKYFSLATVFAILFVFVACNKNADVSTDTPTIKKSPNNALILTPNTFDFVGEWHNEGLDYVFDNVIKNNANITYNNVNNASIEYISKVNEYTKLTEEEIKKLQSEENKKLIAEILKQQILSADFLKKHAVLTPNQEQFIIELSKFVNDNEMSLDNTLKGIIAIEKDAIEKFGEDEIIDVLCLSSIAKHSLRYWTSKENQKKWRDVVIVLGDLDDDEPLLVNWRNVAIADILGFGVGFPSGVTVGMVAGGLAAGVYTAGAAAGIGAVLGGFVGGTVTGLTKAIAASAAALIAEWIADALGF